jgi:hypothetical protein
MVGARCLPKIGLSPAPTLFLPRQFFIHRKHFFSKCLAIVFSEYPSDKLGTSYFFANGLPQDIKLLPVQFVELLFIKQPVISTHGYTSLEFASLAWS